MEYRELVQTAKAMGINSHGVRKDELAKLVAEAQEGVTTSDDVEVAATDERKQAAKDARMNGRARRGGALLGKSESRLNVPQAKIAGFKTHWFKDEGGRLQAARANDWDLVEGVDPITSGTNKDGSIRKLYLHKKPLEWHEEDQLKKREKDLQKDRMLKKGEVPSEEYAAAAAGLSMTDEGAKINKLIKR